MHSATIEGRVGGETKTRAGASASDTGQPGVDADADWIEQDISKVGNISSFLKTVEGAVIRIPYQILGQEVAHSIVIHKNDTFYLQFSSKLYKSSWLEPRRIEESLTKLSDSEDAQFSLFRLQTDASLTESLDSLPPSSTRE